MVFNGCQEPPIRDGRHACSIANLIQVVLKNQRFLEHKKCFAFFIVLEHAQEFSIIQSKIGFQPPVILQALLEGLQIFDLKKTGWKIPDILVIINKKESLK